MKKGLFLLIVCTTLLVSCDIQKDTTQPQTKTEKHLSRLFDKQEQAHKQKFSFHGVKDKSGKINILVIGVDSRGEKSSRSDAIMIAQYNPKNKQGKLVSIMRDSYVEIPNYRKKYNKINTSYYIGGPELLRQTVKKNFNIDVEHFVTIDFKGFAKVVDIVAPKGIEVDVKQKIIDDMGLHLKPGVQKLHGKELLSYARFRHDGESDFGRVRRQQEVLTSLRKEFVDKISSVDGVFKLPSIGEEVLQYVDTDMDFKTFISLGGNILFNKMKSVETMRIPVNSGYTDKSYQHAGQVLELNIPKNKEVLKEFLIDEPTPVHKDKEK